MVMSLESRSASLNIAMVRMLTVWEPAELEKFTRSPMSTLWLSVNRPEPISCSSPSPGRWLRCAGPAGLWSCSHWRQAAAVSDPQCPSTAPGAR